jgi:BirA family biotin operon repressor/biotin-[acetyl-CoA-carboxylase] ligase
MIVLKIHNPFNAPVYCEETVSSTMDISRKLALENSPHGSVILADFQEAGRGRIQNRRWETQRGENLSFTILLRYSNAENIPSALTLRAGLAVCLAIEDFEPSLQNLCLVKWPNDILIKSKDSGSFKKAVGILCEAEDGNVHLGIGVNVTQKDFPSHLKEKAVSIALAADRDISKDERLVLLEKILLRLYDELDAAQCRDAGGSKNDWRHRLEQKLYKKGEQVLFIEGAADSGKEVRGSLAGITDTGEILIIPNGEKKERSFIAGELSFAL